MSSPEHLASVTPLPWAAEGVSTPTPEAQNFASDLPVFDLAIDNIKTINFDRFDGGVRIDRRYRLTDGAAFIGRLTLSDSDRHKTLLSHRLPWCTNLEGLYTDVDEEHARRGSTSMRVSSQQTGIKQAAKNLVDAVCGENNMLARDAYVQHLVLDHVDSLGYTLPKQAIETGDSKGAMTNLAAQAYAPQFGRRLVYNDLTDPCLEHGIDLRKATPESIANNLKYFTFNEPRALYRALRSHPVRKLPQLGQSLTLDPGFWVNQVATGFALFSGKSGGFVEHIPSDSVTAVRFFRHSEFNHSMDWLLRFVPFKGIHPYREEGAHLSIAEPDVQESTIDRVELAQELLRSGLMPSELRAEMIVEQIAKKRLAASAARSNHAVRRPVRTAG